MPRVMLITTSYPENSRGREAAGSFVEDFAQELSQLVDVTVLASGHENRVDVNGRLGVRRFAVPRLPVSLLRAYNPLDWRAIKTTLLAGWKAAKLAAADDRPDHILALWALPSGWWARAANVPYSTWSLGSDIWSLSRIPVVRRVLIDVLQGAENRFADGFELCGDVERLSKRPCSFLPSTRALPALPSTAKAKCPPWKLAFLGRWHPNKGADLLMRSLQHLDDGDWARIEEVRFFGGGPLESEIRAAAEKLVSEHRPVTLGGYLDKREAAELIGWADYLLLPSRVESIPVIFSDAMQVGTPIIATPVGDLPRLQELYGFGVLAEDTTSTAFADAIRTAAKCDVSYVSGGLQRARSAFDLGTIAAQFLQEIGVRTE